jgi:hypothetical protein
MQIGHLYTNCIFKYLYTNLLVVNVAVISSSVEFFCVCISGVVDTSMILMGFEVKISCTFKNEKIII